MNAGRLRKDGVWEVALALWRKRTDTSLCTARDVLPCPEEEFQSLFRRPMEKFLNGLKSEAKRTT